MYKIKMYIYKMWAINGNKESESRIIICVYQM